MIANRKEFEELSRRIIGDIIFVEFLGLRVVHIHGVEGIGGNIGLGFTIEEPPIFLDNGFVKDVLFGVVVSRVGKGLAQVSVFQGAMAKNLLVFGMENEVGTLNVNTVFDGAIAVVCFLVFVRGRAQCHEEAQLLVVVELVEVSEIADVTFNEFMDMSHGKLSLQGPFRRVFEVEVNKDGCMLIGPALFDEVQRASLIREEVIMEMIQKQRILFILHIELSSHCTHARKRAGFTFFGDPMGETAQRGFPGSFQ